MANADNISPRCSMEDCDKIAKTRGLCIRHYTLFRNNGDPSIQKRASPGNGTIDSFGYRLITVNGRRIREHRYVMEQALGRRLASTEIVHHVDGNKLNNALENLELTTRDLHPKEHASFRSDTHKECSLCHQILPREKFHLNSLASFDNNRDPHGSQCKDCDLQEQSRRNKQKRATCNATRHSSEQP